MAPQGLDDDDTPGTSVVEGFYAFQWGTGALGRSGAGTGRLLGLDYYRYLDVVYGAGWFSARYVALQDPGDAEFHSNGIGAARGKSATVGYFPAGGDRDAVTGVYYTVGERGHFWSSASSNTDARSASLSWFPATDFYASSSGNRGFGFTVRCVQEEFTYICTRNP